MKNNGPVQIGPTALRILKGVPPYQPPPTEQPLPNKKPQPDEKPRPTLNGNVSEQPNHTKKPNKKEIPMPKWYRSEDLDTMDIPPLKEFAHGLLTPGVTMIVGKPKAGKSWLALHIAMSLIRGTAVCGHFQVPDPCKVWYCALEDNERRMIEREAKFFQGQPSSGRRDLYYTHELEGFNTGAFEQLDRMLTEQPAQVLIIDTWFNFTLLAKASRDPVRDDYSRVKPLLAIGKKHECCILIIHHTRKNALTGIGDEIDSVNGTTGLTAAVDTYLLLSKSKQDKTRKLFMQSRTLKDQVYELKFEAENEQFEITALGEEAQLSDERKEIVNYLAGLELGEAAASNIIARAISKNESTTRRLIQMLYQSNVICRTMKGHKYYVRNAHGGTNVEL